MKENELVQLTSSDIGKIRSDILKEQNGNCALCGCEITEQTGYSLDHQHMLKREEIGIDGAGLIRGVCCRACNVLEGKVWNNTQRFIQAKTVQDRINWLESLIVYYKKENYKMIHPSEKPKEKLVSKSKYNKLKKLYSGKRKFPEYPKSGKLNVALKQLFNEYNIEPYN